ncbi:MAG: magnesium transporter CorA family protein [Hyphomicrobium sp.]|nr:magnesium transporter CorA family protein [Hyphomicrobium sp.]
MLTIYKSDGANLTPRPESSPLTDECIWIDLLQPTQEEIAFVEHEFGIEIPTRAEMREIEPSNRYFLENGAYFMTASIVYNIEEPVPLTSAVTFILAGNRLVTVRHADPRAVPLFLQRVEKGDAPCAEGSAIMIGLLEALIHRMADLIERIQDEVDRLAQGIFGVKGGQQTRSRRYDVLLRGIGKAGDITARAEDSATSLSRMFHYYLQVVRERGDDSRTRQRIKAAQRDISSLMDHTRFLSTRIAFLLEATLGMISIEQSQIIKLFSVMAVVLLPPTLVASIYGMNFKYMPEIDWLFGYPFALGLMFVAALVPFLYFRRKGWL